MYSSKRKQAGVELGKTTKRRRLDFEKGNGHSHRSVSSENPLVLNTDTALGDGGGG